MPVGGLDRALPTVGPIELTGSRACRQAVHTDIKPGRLHVDLTDTSGLVHFDFGIRIVSTW